MAVTVDQASLGTAATSESAVITTTATVAAGGMIVVLAGMFNATAASLHTVAGGSLTWVSAHTVQSGSYRISLFYAFAPSGLASGTGITVSDTGGTSDITCCAASYLGVDTSGTVVALNGGSASTAAWASGSVAANSGDAIIGGAAGDGTLRTSTPTAPAVERVDFNSATTSGSITLVDKLTVAGSDSVAGTWSGTLDHRALGVAFKAAAVAATEIPILVMAPPIPA